MRPSINIASLQLIIAALRKKAANCNMHQILLLFFGEVVKGLDVIDKIADVQTSRAQDRDRPLEDVRVIKAKLVKRKKS